MSDEYNQSEYISIQVCDPITIADEKGSYTRYTIKTEVWLFFWLTLILSPLKTTFPEYRKREFQVFRRYSEFKVLRELLKTEFDTNPKAIKFGDLPALPGDTIFSLFSKQARLDPDFIEKRREGLEAVFFISLHFILFL